MATPANAKISPIAISPDPTRTPSMPSIYQGTGAVLLTVVAYRHRATAINREAVA